MGFDSVHRLRSLPWASLEGLGGTVLPAIEEVLSGVAAERVIDRLLRANRGLSSEQRTAAVEAVFGVALWRRRLAFHAGVDDWRKAEPALLLFSLLHDLAGVPEEQAARLAGSLDLRPAGAGRPLPPTPSSAAAERGLRQGSVPESQPEIRPGPAAAERGLRQMRPRCSPEVERGLRQQPGELGVRLSYPDWLVELFRRELGDEAEPFAEATNLPGPICLRANRLKTNPEALARILAAEDVPTRKAPWGPDALLVERGRPNILGLAAHRDGLFEVQDEGSQLLGQLLEARPGETVLDFCAGAGGKALLLAAEMKNEGTLLAHDPDLERLDRLERRAARAGATCIRALREPPPPGLRADRVLVDAPCSELGTLRRGPDLRFRVDPGGLGSFPELQSRILEAAQRHVRPGGRLVYATCTLRREENQEIALDLQRRHPELTRIRPGAGWLPDDFVRDDFFLCLPHRHGTDAFFAAVFERDG